MENASKALIIAGSVLISLLVISALVFMFNQLSAFEQAKADSQENAKMAEYMQKFEQFNKKAVYGSELLSLANLTDDYNLTQGDYQGYNKVNITVYIKNDFETYIRKGNREIQDIRAGSDQLKGIIADYEDNESRKAVRDKKGIKHSVKYYAQLSYRQIATIFKINFSSNDDDYAVNDSLKRNYNTKNLMTDIEKYISLKSIQTQFKNTPFKCTDVTYDDIGRIKQMKFEQM